MLLGNLHGRSVALVDGELVDVCKATDGAIDSDPMAFADLATHDVLRESLGAKGGAEGALVPSSTELAPPIPRPTKILAAALNYRPHAAESGFEAPATPALFARLPSALAGPADDIVLPAGRDQIDWEAELVLVVGREARNIDPDQGWTYVAGLTAGQDVSDRRAQFEGPSQFTMAKSYDSFAPTGPYMATLDEFENVDAIRLSCVLNGDEVQRGNTQELIHDVGRLLAYASSICTLNPGDLIFTGTPAGVGWGMSPQRFLQPGDVLETVIPGIGTMRNHCVSG
jgi:2,4-diketo-3-deoxy-L-fuconate hydrolase